MYLSLVKFADTTTASRLKIATASFLEFDSSTASVKKLKFVIPCVILVEREKRSRYKNGIFKNTAKMETKKIMNAKRLQQESKRHTS